MRAITSHITISRETAMLVRVGGGEGRRMGGRGGLKGADGRGGLGRVKREEVGGGRCAMR